jgi:hypothetical protein
MQDSYSEGRGFHVLEFCTRRKSLKSIQQHASSQYPSGAFLCGGFSDDTESSISEFTTLDSRVRGNDTPDGHPSVTESAAADGSGPTSTHPLSRVCSVQTSKCILTVLQPSFQLSFPRRLAACNNTSRREVGLRKSVPGACPGEQNHSRAAPRRGQGDRTRSER